MNESKYKRIAVLMGFAPDKVLTWPEDRLSGRTIKDTINLIVKIIYEKEEV